MTYYTRAWSSRGGTPEFGVFDGNEEVLPSEIESD